MNRRACLAALPVAAVAGVVPVGTIALGAAPAASDGQTEVERLFEKLKVVRAERDRGCPGLSAEEDDALYYRVLDAEDDIMRAPSQSAKDMAIKMVVGHLEGELTCLDYDGLVWAEARALVGGAA